MREKIFVVLFIFTVLLGTAVTLESTERVPSLAGAEWLRVNNLAINVSDSLTIMVNRMRGALDGTSLLYGGISLLALVMIGMTLKLGRDAELRALRSKLNTLEERLSEALDRKERAEKSLNVELKKNTELAREKESVIQEVEESLRKNHKLATDLREKHAVLKARDGELRTLRSQVDDLRARLEEMTSINEQTEKRLREELSKKTEPVLPNVRTNAQPEKSVNGRVQALKTQLIKSQEMVKIREGELETLRSQANSLTGQLAGASATKERAENLLQEELGRRNELLAEKDAVIQELEEKLRQRVNALEAGLGEKQDLLEARDRELATLRSEVATLAEQMAELSAAKKQADSLHKDKLEELDKNLSEQVKQLKKQLSEKQDLVKSRDVELEIARSEANDLSQRLAQASSLKERAESALQQAAAAQAQITALTSAREETERLLQEQITRNNDLRQERESALRELDQTLAGRLRALESGLNEKEEQLTSREGEIQTLRSEVNSLTERLSQTAFAKERAEKFLQVELRKNHELVQEKESAIKETAVRFSERLRALENELGEKQHLLKSRDEELETLRSQLNVANDRLADTVSATERVESLLQEELSNLTEEKEAVSRDFEVGLKTIQSLEIDLSEKVKLLESRDCELKTLRSEMSGLTARLEEIESDKHRAEKSLEEEVRQKQELLSNGAATRKLLRDLNARLNILENELEKNQKVLAQRDKELATVRSESNALMPQLAELGSAKERLAILLQDERGKNEGLVEKSASAIKELEETLGGRAGALQMQLNEKNALLEGREKELQALRSEIATLSERLAASHSARARPEQLLQEELRKIAEFVPLNATAANELNDGRNATIQSLQNQLNEKQEALRKRDNEIESLASELREKKILLAREEIADLQSIRRRNTWKRRLAKFGIPTKPD